MRSGKTVTVTLYSHAALVPTATRVSMLVVRVTGRANGGAVETAAGPDLDEGGRHQQQPVDGLHGQPRLRPPHHDHDAQRHGDRHAGLDEQLALLQPARGVLRLQLRGHAQLGCGRRRLGADVVAGGLDGGHQLLAPDQRRVGVNGRPLGGQVDVGVDDAVGLAQESLDAVDAGGAGHALDGQHHLDGRGWLGGAGLHTPLEYPIDAEEWHQLDRVERRSILAGA